MTIEEYLRSLERFVDDAYGRRMRTQFQSSDGASELAMLAAPTRAEYEQCCRLVDSMTAEQKAAAERLSDEQVAALAEQAGVDAAVAAIFVNGYAIRKVKFDI